MSRRAFASVVAVAALLGCARDESTKLAADSVATSPTNAAVLRAQPSTDSGARSGSDCVSAGAWQACSVEKRLTDAGFVPQRQEAPAAALFSVEGIEYALGPARLHVYVFPSAEARAAAVATIDTVAIARRDTPATWGGPAWLITSNNLVAVLVSDNARLVERVQLALTAGLPSASD